VAIRSEYKGNSERKEGLYWGGKKVEKEGGTLR
jgi:hypothetical protein